MARFWPGAITLVIPRAPELAADLGDDDATIGVRCPDHAVPRAVARSSDRRHDEREPARRAHAGDGGTVAEVFGDAVAVVVTAVRAGSPSTVVDCTGIEPKLLPRGTHRVGRRAGRLA